MKAIHEHLWIHLGMLVVAITLVSCATHRPFYPDYASARQVRVYTTDKIVDHGLLILGFPEAICETNRNTEYTFTYSVANAMAGDVFIDSETVDLSSGLYSDPGLLAQLGGSFSHVHPRHYALLTPPPGRCECRWVVDCCSSVTLKGHVSLPSIHAGGLLKINLRIEGFLRKNGQPFKGETEIQVPVIAAK